MTTRCRWVSVATVLPVISPAAAGAEAVNGYDPGPVIGAALLAIAGGVIALIVLGVAVRRAGQPWWAVILAVIAAGVVVTMIAGNFVMVL